jgi:hypothetical protein
MLAVMLAVVIAEAVVQHARAQRHLYRPPRQPWPAPGPRERPRPPGLRFTPRDLDQQPDNQERDAA